MNQIQAWADKVGRNVETVFYGNGAVVKHTLAALLAQGHVLLDDLPGLGKTLFARALAVSVGAKLSRIQATPDLMPSDVLGVSIYNPQDGGFKFRRGPIMANILLVDEINRATPRTQSALLEAMAEQQVTVEGKSLALPAPFFLIATQNPVDFEGTFPLPEAQKDRFLLTLSLGYPSREIEKSILANHGKPKSPLADLREVAALEEIAPLQELVGHIHVSDSIVDYLLALAEATRSDDNLRMGISPRGSLALYRCSQALAAIEGRDFVSPEDVRALAVPAFISRILPKPQALIKGLDARGILEAIIERVPSPQIGDARDRRG